MKWGILILIVFIVNASTNIIIDNKKIHDKELGITFYTAPQKESTEQTNNKTIDDTSDINYTDNIQQIQIDSHTMMIDSNAEKEWVDFEDIKELPYKKLKPYTFKSPVGSNTAFDTIEAIQHLLDERTIITRYGFPQPDISMPEQQVYHVYYVRQTNSVPRITQQMLENALREYFRQREATRVNREKIERENFVKQKIQFELEHQFDLE